MKEIYMDEVNNTAVLLTDITKEILEEDFDVETTDKLYNRFQAELDKLCGYPDYRNYN